MATAFSNILVYVLNYGGHFLRSSIYVWMSLPTDTMKCNEIDIGRQNEYNRINC